MKMPAKLKTAVPLSVWLAFSVVSPAHAEINSSGLLDTVLERYANAASSWGTVIQDAASWLFWTLVLISMVWTFGMMALRKADIGEFFAEFTRFTIFTGFFWWLLINGPNFASDIYDSMRQIAGNATNLGPNLSPSGIVDVGFEIFDRVLDQSSVWSPVDSACGIIIAVIILVILALIGINMLLLLAAGWVLAYGGVFFLGFGGSRWTSDMAINYYKTVLGVGVQLMAMVLLIGIGKTFLDDYYNAMSQGVSLKEMGVLLIVAVILLVLITKVPQMLSGVITGAGAGGTGIGSFGAGAALGAAGVATAAAMTGGAAMAAGASNMAGGAQALKAAFNKANENVANGSDLLSAFSGGGDDSGSGGNLGGGGENGGGSGGAGQEAGTGDTPFAQAAGFDSSSQNASGSSDSAQSSSSGSNDSGQSSSDSATASANGGNGSQEQGSDTATAAAATTGGFMAGAGRAGRVAADTGANLAKGAAAVAKAKAGKMKGKAMQRIGNTTGGKIAAAIKAQGQGGAAAENAGGSGTPSEPTQGSDNASFANDSLSGGDSTGGGWMNQTGGFDNLSSEQQEQAIQSHAQWQENDPENHTFDVGDYVSYAQERNAEVASFVNKGRSA